MEMTQSAFNVLLDMTSLREMVTQEVNEAKRMIQSQAAQLAGSPTSGGVMTPAQAEVHRPQLSADANKVYYFDGERRAHLSREELLSRIQAQPGGSHIIWVPRREAWVSWRSIPNLVRAVSGDTERVTLRQDTPREVRGVQRVQEHLQEQLNNQRAQVVALRARASTHHHRATEPITTKRTSVEQSVAEQSVAEQTVVEQTVAARYWPLAPIASQAESQAQGNYLSIPETDFTRFQIDLAESDQLSLYMGGDGKLESGGLFIKTPRALNVGDYIQLKITRKDVNIASFEAPVQWLKLPQGPRDHFGGGVGVEWPNDLPAHVMRAMKAATSDADYDFYDA